MYSQVRALVIQGTSASDLCSTGGVKDEVMKLFDWWAGYNEIVPQFSSHAAGLPQQQSSHSSSSVSTQNIAVEEVVQVRHTVLLGTYTLCIHLFVSHE